MQLTKELFLGFSIGCVVGATILYFIIARGLMKLLKEMDDE